MPVISSKYAREDVRSRGKDLSTVNPKDRVFCMRFTGEVFDTYKYDHRHENISQLQPKYLGSPIYR